MNDLELKENLETLRHSIIRVQFKLDEINLKSLIFNRQKLKNCSVELTELSQSLAEVEDAFDQNINIPKDINGAIVRASQLSILFNIRKTTNDSLSNAKSTLNQLYSNINFYRSLSVALIALVASIIGLILNVI